ncbi:hypothetical protein L1887_17088 [Cichorium endivia]|nr:hypothetical protein L1887_17088 [Cichorium endivia]
MREEADDDFLLKVIKNGAFSVMKRPLTDDLVVQLRRHVIRERIHKLHKCRMHYESESKEPESTSSSGRRKTVQGLENESCGATKKICLEWTKELHTKFIKAVQKLGEGKCFPREILDTMKVPGLTRMQVASHLQKCREYGWNFNEKRGPTSSLKTSTFSTNISQEVGFRRFGRMPPVAKPVDNEEERTTHVDASFSSNGVYMDVNHMNNQSVHDSSSGFGFQNSGQVLTSPSVGQGSYCHIFPQNDQVSADFFDFGNDINGNESLAYMQLNVLGKNYNCISEQSYPYYDQVIPNQVTSLCNNHMSREVGELDTLVLYHDYFQNRTYLPRCSPPILNTTSCRHHSATPAAIPVLTASLSFFYTIVLRSAPPKLETTAIDTLIPIQLHHHLSDGNHQIRRTTRNLVTHGLALAFLSPPTQITKSKAFYPWYDEHIAVSESRSSHQHILIARS